MSVRRSEAVINEALDLRIKFFDDSDGVFDPYSISQVVIQDADTDEVLETITSTTKIATGIYQVITSAAWNTTARPIRDIWTFKRIEGGVDKTGIQSTFIFSTSSSPSGLPSASDVISYLEGYGIGSEQISNSWIESRRDNLVVPWIKNHTRLAFDAETEYTEYLSGNGSNLLVLSRKPINSLVSIQYVNMSESIEGITESVELNSEDGILIKKALVMEGDSTTTWLKGKENIKVVYNAGYDNFVNPETSETVDDVKEAIIYMLAKQALIQIGARTGGGSISSQAWSRNFGNRGKYSDIINNLDCMAYEILRPYMTGVSNT